MPRKLAEGPLLLLDACCLINLFATGRIEEILAGLPYRFTTSRWVATQEVLTIGQATSSDGPLEREIIPQARLEGLITILDLATEREMDDFVRFATELDDGEAGVCALAVSHSGMVGTDDRKALRVLAQKAPQVATIQTPELLYEWAHRTAAHASDIASVLRAVFHRGRFTPRRGAPRYDWWISTST